MVFDTHDRAFAFFKGACTRGIYDNMKTAVETIFVGKERALQPPFRSDVRPSWGRCSASSRRSSWRIWSISHSVRP